MTTNIGFACWHCGTKLGDLDFGRKDLCPKCKRDTKVCKNCTHYDSSVNNQCRESQAELVTQKEKSNFCDYFAPSNKNSSQTNKPDPKALAEAFFKKKG